MEPTVVIPSLLSFRVKRGIAVIPIEGPRALYRDAKDSSLRSE